MKRIAATLIQDFSPESQHSIEVPIWVYEIDNNSVLPVKFEYRQKGYKGLRFSERLSRVIFN